MIARHVFNILSFAILSLPQASSSDVVVTLMDGMSQRGVLSRLSHTELTVIVNDDPTTIPADQISTVQFSQHEEERFGAIQVGLIDNSILSVSDVTNTAQTVRMSRATGDPIECSTSLLLWMRLNKLDDVLKPRWNELLSAERTTDQIVVLKDDDLVAVDGVIEGVTVEHVQFELGGSIVNVSRERVTGLLFYHPNKRDAVKSVATLQDISGSRLYCNGILMENATVVTSLSCGLRLSYPMDQIVMINFAESKLVYLGQLEPSRVVSTPFFDFIVPPRKNRSLSGESLRLDGKVYDKGMGLQSRTSCFYEIDGEFKRFQSLVGIDDSVRPRGHALVMIKLDGQIVWQENVSGKQKPYSLDIDVHKAKTMELTVDFGLYGSEADFVNFCDAKLIR